MSDQTLDLNILAEMTKLDKLIRHHADLFFNKNTSEISDSEYDALVEKFDKLCQDHPDEADTLPDKDDVIPISVAGTELPTHTFDMAMLSLKKAFNQGDMNIFYHTLPEGATRVYEYKLDGIGLEIHYEHGKLINIFTRGSGNVGEVVTHALPLFDQSVPEHVPALADVEKYIVRGEAFISHENFAFYNSIASKPASNNRNSVSGWIRALANNQNPLVRGLLSFNIYWFGDSLGETTYSATMDKLQQFGFVPAPRVSELHIANNVRSDTLPVDGVVIKVDELDHQREMGERTQSPRWAIAYKFPAISADTRLLDVAFQVGRTGYITPVGIYSPVDIMGVQCTRATLHNYRHFLSQGLRVGSIVTITRNGDVIPHIARVVEVGNGPHIKSPKNCPSCGEVLSHEGENKEVIHLRCTNITSCPAQLAQRIYNMVDKDAFYIDGLGLVTIGKLVEQGFVKAPADIFKVPPECLNRGLYQRINEARTVPLNRFIKALSLPNVGVVTASNIAKAVGQKDLLAFLMDADQLVVVDDIGPGTAFEISVACSEEEFIKQYHALMNEVTVIAPQTREVMCKVAITGTSSLPRGELEELLSDHHIELSDRITKDCKYILVGAKPSSAKITKATNYGIETVILSQVKDLKQLVERILV